MQTKYYTTITDFSGNTYTVNLKKDGYTGSTSQISAYALSPLSINYATDGSKETDSTICGSDLTFSFRCAETDNDKFDEVFESNYKEWQVEILKNSTLYWIGWIQPDELSRSYVRPAYFISLSATDGIGDLKNIDYPFSATFNKESTISIIKKILDETGIELDIKAQVNLVNEKISTSLLNGLYLNPYRFITFQSGKIKYTSCYDALNHILEGMYCKLFQSNGFYYIRNKSETVSDLVTYDWDVLTGATTTSHNPVINIDDYFVHIDSDELSKIRPLKQYTVTHDDITGGIQISTASLNSEFDTDITGWSNADFPHEFFDFAWVSGKTNAGFNGCLYTESKKTPGNDPNQDNYFTSNAFNIYTASASTVTVSLDAFVDYLEFSGATALPTIRVELVFTDIVDTTESYQDYVLSTGTTYNLMPILPFTNNGLHYLKIWVRMDNATTNFYNTMKVYFDNIFVEMNSGVQKKIEYEGIYNNTTAISKEEDTIYFNDNTNRFYVGALFYNNSNTGLTTTSWHNYGYTGVTTSFAKLYAYNKLQARNRFKNYLKLRLKNSAIEFHNILQLDSKYYSILTYQNDLKNNNLNLELVELLTDNIGVSFNQFNLTS